MFKETSAMTLALKAMLASARLRLKAKSAYTKQPRQVRNAVPKTVQSARVTLAETKRIDRTQRKVNQNLELWVPRESN